MTSMLKEISGMELFEHMKTPKVEEVHMEMYRMFKSQATLHEALAVSTLLVMDCIQNYLSNWESEDLKNGVCIEVVRLLEDRFGFVGSEPPEPPIIQ